MQVSIYADLRCLQDENYRVRGIGQHVASLLRARPQSAFATCRTIGLIDAQLPDLLPEFRSLADEVTYSTNPCCNHERALFVDGSPMGHDSRFTVRFVNHPAFLRAAVVYDFIPFDWPGYLPAVPSRIDYIAKLARLRKFDFFFPISEYTARRATELVGIPRSRVAVTGAAVRRAIYELRHRVTEVVSPYDGEGPYFFVTFGGDPRKNIEVAIKAVRYLNLVYARRIPLKVAGHYDVKVSGHYNEACKRNLLRLAGHAEGEGFLEFCPGVSDEELVSLYSGAIATIVPSHIEGFSLPVVEAAACGCPVVASSCAAHLELIDQPEALFASDDVAALCGKLDGLLNNPALRDSLKKTQAYLGPKFHEDAVGGAFWSGLESFVNHSAKPPAVSQRKKPHLALLSPYPPDRGDSALYTANAMRAGERFFYADLYTNAPRPLTFEGSFTDAGRVSWAALVNTRYDAVISTVGSSCSDPDILAVLRRFGGPCILHDSPPFLESIAKHARPLIVHTSAQRAEIKSRYGADAQLLPCCPTELFSDDDLATGARDAVRSRLGIRFDIFFVSAFGPLMPEKDIHTCIAAIDLLRSWNIPADLYFVGDAGADGTHISGIASSYGIGKHVHVISRYLDEANYRNFLIASDVAVQVGTDTFLRLPSSVIDCISAGLPCVTLRDSAVCSDAPPYIHTVPDRSSCLQVAEMLALVWESSHRRDSYADARAAYVETHSFSNYAQRLVEILGIA